MQRWGFSLIDRKLLKLRGFELGGNRRNMDMLTVLCPRYFYMKPLSELWNFTPSKILYCRLYYRGFALQNWSKLNKVGLNKEHREGLRVYRNVQLLWDLRCVDEYIRKTVWWRHCEKDVGRKTLLECQWRCEKDVVRKNVYWLGWGLHISDA